LWAFNGQEGRREYERERGKWVGREGEGGREGEREGRRKEGRKEGG